MTGPITTARHEAFRALLDALGFTAQNIDFYELTVDAQSPPRLTIRYLLTVDQAEALSAALKNDLAQ